MHTKESIRKQVEVLQQFLGSGFCDKCSTPTTIGRSQAYHIIAKIHGFENWVALSHRIKIDEQARKQWEEMRDKQEQNQE